MRHPGLPEAFVEGLGGALRFELKAFFHPPPFPTVQLGASEHVT